MKHTLFYLNMALTGLALKIGLALCLLGTLLPIPFIAWAVVVLFIDSMWYALISDTKVKVRYDD